MPRPAALFLLILLAASPAPAADAIRVDPAVRYQTFDGWGTSLAWWAKIVGAFPDPVRGDYMDKVFDPVKGLGLNVVRYNIGGGENPSLHFLSLRARIDGFEPSPGHWDPAADAGQRWVLQQAKARGADTFEAFSNSPPYWMTVSGSVSGAKNGNDGNLAPAREKEFADYLVQVVGHFRDQEGITFRTLEPLNEPISGWWHEGNSQEGCHFDRAAQARLIQLVGRGLADNGLTTRVSAPDENSIGDSLTSFLSYDSATLRYLSQVNTHSYSGSERVPLFRAVAAAHKILWQSEYGDGDASGLSLAAHIITDLNEMHTSAWTYWQAVDGDRWGLLTNAADGTVSDPTVGKKYWTFANFTRYIRPKAVFLKIDDPNSVAALDPTGDKLTVVTLNRGDHARDITLDLTAFGNNLLTLAAYRTTPHENLAPLTDLDLAHGIITARLPEKSVTTLVVTGLKP